MQSGLVDEFFVINNNSMETLQADMTKLREVFKA